MKAKTLLKFSEKKDDPEKAMLEEVAKIAKKERNHVWEGTPLPPKRNPVAALLGWH